MRFKVLVSVLVILSLWLAVTQRNLEMKNRQALASAAETVNFRLTQISNFTEASAWTDTSDRIWLYNSIYEIIEYGWMAERIPVRGSSSLVSQELGQLTRLMMPYREVAARIAFSPEITAEDRAAIGKLAEQVRTAGWVPGESAGSPIGWTGQRSWAELSAPLSRLVNALR